MCTETIIPLSFTGFLQDPLVRLAMHSDGVSEHDLSELLERVRQATEPTRMVAHSLQPAH
jgi:hypothetical protein